MGTQRSSVGDCRAAAEAIVAERRATILSASLYILVIDDEPDGLDMLAASLAEEGHRVATARNGAAAIERLCDPGPPPDVILLDLEMPGMDGYEFRDLQRRYVRWATIPVIVLAGFIPPDRVQALNAAAVLVKPVAVGSLLAAIDLVYRRGADAE